jgi:hypothetical protein
MNVGSRSRDRLGPGSPVLVQPLSLTFTANLGVGERRRLQPRVRCARCSAAASNEVAEARGSHVAQVGVQVIDGDAQAPAQRWLERLYLSASEHPSHLSLAALQQPSGFGDGEPESPLGCPTARHKASHGRRVRV